MFRGGRFFPDTVYNCSVFIYSTVAGHTCEINLIVRWCRTRSPAVARRAVLPHSTLSSS